MTYRVQSLLNPEQLPIQPLRKGASSNESTAIGSMAPAGADFNLGASNHPKIQKGMSDLMPMCIPNPPTRDTARRTASTVRHL
jgi:hypothetical protein